MRLLNAFLKEAHWLNSGHLPKAEDYLNNGIVSTGVHVVLIHAFFLLDNAITKENAAIMNDNFPNIIYSVAKILRLSDDLEGAKVKIKYRSNLSSLKVNAPFLDHIIIKYIFHECRVKIKMVLMGRILIAT